MKFETKSKLVSKGTKTKLTVLCDGVEIGSRTSARPYQFALVVTRNQNWDLDYCRRNAIWHRQCAAQYRAISLHDATAIAAHIKEGFSRASIENRIVDGSYAKWATESQEAAARCDAEVARLSAGPLPEYAVPYVSSWHQTRKNVADASPSQIFVAIIAGPWPADACGIKI